MKPLPLEHRYKARPESHIPAMLEGLYGSPVHAPGRFIRVVMTGFNGEL